MSEGEIMKQEVFDTLTELEMRDERDRLKGITENVIVGSNIPIGSGTVDLYMQVSKKKEDKLKLSDNHG